MSDKRPHINERLHTELANSGRAAGIGISEDDYSEESKRPHCGSPSVHVKLPSDYLTDEQRNALNGEVKIIKGAK